MLSLWTILEKAWFKQFKEPITLNHILKIA